MSTITNILNTVLDFEKESADLALLYSQIADDMAMPNLGDFFREMHQGENRHINQICERILQIGGEIKLDTSVRAKPLTPVQDMFATCRDGKQAVIDFLNHSIPQCRDANDEATVELLSRLVLDEVEHLDEFESELDLMKIMGCGSYLTKWIVK